MGDGGGGFFADEATFREAGEAEGLEEVGGAAGGDQLGDALAGDGAGLEAALRPHPGPAGMANAVPARSPGLPEAPPRPSFPASCGPARAWSCRASPYVNLAARSRLTHPRVRHHITDDVLDPRH